MGKIDIYESDYLENSEIFADLVNGVLYGGEQVVKPQELGEQDGELRSILGRNVKKTIRDKVKLWNGMALTVFSVESQTRVDYRMVVRAMLAESMGYDKQCKKFKEKLERERKEKPNSKKKAAKLTQDEFLSGMRKSDRFTPIITIVVYYGKEKPWDGAKELHELLDIGRNEKKILPFVSNYRLNLFDYHDYENFGQFRSELQYVFEFLRYSGEKDQMKKKLAEHKKQYDKMSCQAKILLTKLTNIKEISGVKPEEFAKGEFSMCKAFEDMKEEGRIEGIKEGIKKGERKARKEREKSIRSLLRVIKQFNGSKEQGINILIEEHQLSRKAAMKKVALYW